MDFNQINPDLIFDGGDLDCGSGLALLLREHISQLAVGGVLEMRSREPTVADDLPPWCRMTGHEYLGSVPEADCVRYFVQRGQPTADEEQAFQDDKQRARDYEWRVRARSTGHLKSKVYFRNFSVDVGQPASFQEKDEHPSAVEYLLAALAGSLSTAFATECAKDGLEVDDIEIAVKGKLENVLAHLGVEQGDPSFRSIELKCFASTLDDAEKVRAAWQRTLARSPLVQTISKAVQLESKLAIV
jgi:uncharacterized OsmC-like protein/TusA-related sulfurtransferase